MADDVVLSRRKLINITQALHVFSLCYLSYNKEQLTKLLLGVIIHAIILCLFLVITEVTQWKYVKCYVILINFLLEGTTSSAIWLSFVMSWLSYKKYISLDDSSIHCVIYNNSWPPRKKKKQQLLDPLKPRTVYLI